MYNVIYVSSWFEYDVIKAFSIKAVPKILESDAVVVSGNYKTGRSSQQEAMVLVIMIQFYS